MIIRITRRERKRKRGRERERLSIKKESQRTNYECDGQKGEFGKRKKKTRKARMNRHEVRKRERENQVDGDREERGRKI